MSPRVATCVLLAGGLLLGCSTEDDGPESAPSQSPGTTASTSVAPTDDYGSARELMEDAVQAGLKSCSDPKPVSGMPDGSDGLACKTGKPSTTEFRLYDNLSTRVADQRAFADRADEAQEKGESATSILVNMTGDVFWLVAGPADDLEIIAPQLGGYLTDLSAPDPEPSPEPKPKPKPDPKPEPRKTIAGDGVFEVGRDVAPGTYGNAGPSPDDGRSCVAYTSTRPSDLGSYIAGSTSKGPGIVTLNEGEFFTTQFCKPWKLR